MEVGGLVLGTSGLITVVEKALQLMQGISEARSFGPDLVGFAAELEFEHYRFLLWAQLSGVFNPPTHNIAGPSAQLVVADDLSTQIGEWIKNAAAQLVIGVEEVDNLVKKYQQPSANNVNGGPSSLPSIATGLSTTLPMLGLKHNVSVTAKIDQYRKQVLELQKNNPFRRRFVFGTKPWGEPDKRTLRGKLDEIRHWNDRLASLLPYAVRKTVTQQALPGALLHDANNELLKKLLKASDHQSAAVRLHAKLWKEKLKFNADDQFPLDESVIGQYRRPAPLIRSIRGLAPSSGGLSLIEFQEGRNAPERMTIEWYSFGSTWNDKDITLATNRVAALVHLSSLEDKPDSLRLLKGYCFVEKSDSHGVIRKIPEDASRVKHPVSLNSLIKTPPPGFRPPSLESRLHLAQQLVASVYSFSIVRWFHKDFNTHNVHFFRDNSATSAVIFDAPYVSGLSIARPDNDQQKSLNKELDALSIYLHPDLRTNNPEERPRYRTKYEFYSLGLVLLEIGGWRSIDMLPGVTSALDKVDFKKRVVDRTKKDLPFFMGKRYTDVVLYCLTCADDDVDELKSEMWTLYECVVLELARC